MNDLIWVGNTLYPRWFVIVTPLVVFGVMAFYFYWLSK